MSIPNVSGALRGWTKRQTVRIVTKTVVNHVIQQTAKILTMDIYVGPMPAAQVARKPEEQRTWKWARILTKSSNELLDIDSQIMVNGVTYRINSYQPWREGGYTRYDAIEEFTGNDPMYSVIYDGNGSDGGRAPDTIAYQTGAQPAVLANTYVFTGYVFDSWNTAADGSGTSYAPGDLLTIASADVTLYAQWI